MNPVDQFCWIYGTDAGWTFPIKISPTETVSHLRIVIKNRKLADLGHIDTDRLELYSVPLPDGESICTALARWKPEGRQRLELSKTISDLPSGLIIVHSPDAAKPAIVTVTCYVQNSSNVSELHVEISPTERLSRLRDAIKKLKPVDFRLVDADNLEIYPLPLSLSADDDEFIKAALGTWEPEGQRRLNLSAIISDLSGKLIVRVAEAVKITVMCRMRNSDGGDDFGVQVSPIALVLDLKDAIKTKNSVYFSGIDANKFNLYRVSDDIANDEEAVRTINLREPLHSRLPLAQCFPDPPAVGRIHIVVDVLSPLVPQKHGLEESDAPPPKPVEMNRQSFLANNEPTAPSGAGQPSNFLRRQQDERKTILCGRPEETAATYPLTLLHPSFGEFVSDLHTLEATPDDTAFAAALSAAMILVYDDEKGRVRAILDVFRANGLDFVDLKIDGYWTDGVIVADESNHVCVITEFKNEVGSKGAEPYFQASLYYLEATRRFAADNADPLPCFLLLVFGTQIKFAGAVWSERPMAQTLSHALSTDYHPTDNIMRTEVARHLGAFKKAVQSLKEHHQRSIHETGSFSQPQTFPYPKTFTTWDQRKRTFKYTSQPFQDKLVFFGEVTGPETSPEQICIKFVRRYGREAHDKCTSLKHAPSIYGYEDLPGGWKMIVMQRLLPSDYQSLRDTERSLGLICDIEATLKALHNEGYVHGNVRDTNILVTKSNPRAFVMLNFDWSGKIGEARYPDLKAKEWPEGAKCGAFITAEDDMAMLRKLCM